MANNSNNATNAAREHIEDIRSLFSRVGQPIPLQHKLHSATNRRHAELYTKGNDNHFLMKLIQNAEDNDYLPGVSPTLEFVITTEDITGTGTPATLLIYSNEKGFSKEDIESICCIGRSTKIGKRQFSFAEERGIGFEGMFLVTKQPYIFSNGYQIRFSERPDSCCGIGYPKWVSGKPTVSDIHRVYGSDKILPTTVIVLPLLSEKVNSVKKQLSTVQPEVLLFLSKIKKLSIQEISNDSDVRIATAILISNEIDLGTKKDINADSSWAILSAQEGTNTVKECKYYRWRQRFPWKHDNRVDEVRRLPEWTICLALPFGERLKRGKSSTDVYAFLPIEMETGFPFIIHADFILSSSRKTILLNSKWNLGILDCAGYAFSEAFVAAVKSDEVAPISSMIKVFEFLPTKASPCTELDRVRESIRKSLETKNIIRCETFSTMKDFCKPREAGRILPAFRCILLQLKEQGVPLESISSHGNYLCHSTLDLNGLDDALNFLGVQCFDYEWYAKCIQECNLMLEASEDIYIELLVFIMKNWHSLSRHIANIATLKYLDQNGKIALCSINSATSGTHKIRFGLTYQDHAWLSKWNMEFGCKQMYFLPNDTWLALRKSQNGDFLKSVLKSHAGVEVITLLYFVILVGTSIRREKNRDIVISFTHFLCHSLSRNFISSGKISHYFPSIPVVDRFDRINVNRNAVLVPSSGSRWAELMSSNPWAKENYIELGEEYARRRKFAGECFSKATFRNFVAFYIKAKDIPDLCPPDAGFPLASSHLTKEQAFLLLDWISHLRNGNLLSRNKFTESIEGGKWLKTCAGYNSPNQCLLTDDEETLNLAEMGDFLSHVPIIDEQFYENKIRTYESDLKYLGVKFGLVEAYPTIVSYLMSLAKSTCLTKEAAIALLKLMKYSMEKGILSDENLKILKKLSLKTRFGYKAAHDSILWDSKWARFSEIADLPFIDDSYYGSAIYSFKDELIIMGVVVGFTMGSNLLTLGMKFPEETASASRHALTLLEQIRLLNSEKNELFAADLIEGVRNQPWLKTNIGFLPPTQSFLSDPKWTSLLHVLEVPLIDETFYRSRIGSFKAELQSLGVAVNFDDAKKVICSHFKLLSSSSNFSKRDALSLLNCLKHFEGMGNSPVQEFVNCLSGEKWLRTCHGYKHPTDAILFNSEWSPISEIADLPFIDDTFYGKCIYSYRDELKMMGVAVVLRDGCRFVVKGLKLPKEPGRIMAASALSLLECIRILLVESPMGALPVEFLNLMKSKWILTHMGYKSPDQCFLFRSKPSSVINEKWGGYLEPEDAPFINEYYYGTEISMYRLELKLIGVKVEAGEGCSVLSDILSCHSNFSAIRRIYGYLNEFKWMPELTINSDLRIWIPDQSGTDGEWVWPHVCVLSDVDNLFSELLHVLDKYYEKPLLPFFSMVFDVAESPKTHDYLKLWKSWELKPEHQISTHECCSFWKYICSIWHENGGESIIKSITKLPAKTADGGAQLIDKSDLFIPDDSQLERLFAEASTNPLFVWYPNPSPPTILKSYLDMIYGSLGVRKLSKSAQMSKEFSMDYNSLKVIPRTELIGKGLLKLVLAFLADDSVCTMVRHEIAQYLLGLSFFGTTEPMIVSYSLVLASNESRVIVKARKMVDWGIFGKKLIIQIPYKSDKRTSVEFGCEFAGVVSKAISWRLCTYSTQFKNDLYKLVRLGYFLDFDVDSIECLLKMENLEVLTEDEEFISTAFAPDNALPIVYKRKLESAKQASPSTAEQNRTKRMR